MKLFIFVAVLVSFFSAASVLAQQKILANDTDGTSVAVATVDITNISYAQEQNIFTLSFDISNRTGVQPGIKYGVFLKQSRIDDFSFVDQRVYEETLVLGENETLSKTITYRAPKALSGTYTLYVASETTSGHKYTMVPVADVTLGQNVLGVHIDTTRCYLAVKGGDTTYKPHEQVTIAAHETLVSHCPVQNMGDEQVEVRPMFEMRKYSPFGPVVSMVGGDYTPITLAPRETREIVLELPRATAPQDYVLKFRLGLEGEMVLYRFQIQGPSATVENVLFDKGSYSVGEVAQVTVAWKPVGAYSNSSAAQDTAATVFNEPKIVAIITDENRKVCANPVPVPVDSDGLFVDTLTIPITKDCVVAAAEITIQDGVFGPLARHNYTFKNSVENFNTVSTPVDELPLPMVESEPRSQVSLWLSILGLLLGFGLLLYDSKNQNRREGNKVPLVVLLLLLGCFTFGAERVQANTVPDLVNMGLTIIEPPVTGGGNDVTFENDRPKNHYARAWDRVKVTVRKLLSLNKPQQALAVYQGQVLDLIGVFENNSSVAINTAFTNKFYFQWGGTEGTWNDVYDTGTVTHASLEAGSAQFDTAFFTVPTRENETLYIRYCLDVLDQIVESGVDGSYANCSISSVTVQAGTLVCSTTAVYEDWRGVSCLDSNSCGNTPTCLIYDGATNLTVNAAGPAESFAEEAVELVAQIVNNGSENTGGSFVNLFQVADDSYGTGIVDVGTQVVDPLGGLGQAIVKFNYVFPASSAGTNKFIRVCADKSSAGNSGVIVEANELLEDNCGPWNSILIKPACPAGESKSWTEGGNICTATTPAGIKNSPSTLTDSTAPSTGLAQFLCQNNRTWAVSPNTGATCSANGLAPSFNFENPETVVMFAGTNGWAMAGVRGNDPSGKTIRFGIDDNNDSVIDRWLPSSGYVNSGSAFTVSAQAIPVTPGDYTFNVLVENSDGLRSPFQSRTVALLDSGLTATPGSCGSNSITVTWPNYPSGSVSGHTYEVDGVVLVRNPGSTAYVGYNTSYTDSALTPGVTYSYWLIAIFNITYAWGGTDSHAPFTLPVSATIPVQCDEPDLVAASTTVSVPVVTAGESITFGTGNIINAGTAVANPYTVAGFYIDNDGDGVADYTQVAGDVSLATAAGDSNSRNGIVWNVPVNAPPGIYRVSYIVDSPAVVAEANEDNNFSGWTSFTVSAPVAEPQPWAIIDANPPVVSAGGSSVVTWNSDFYAACSVTGVPPSSDNWNGLSGTETTSLLTIDTTYIVTCDGSPRDSVTIQVNPAVFVAVDKYVIRPGEPIEVVWDTNGNDESLCTMEQNGVVTTEFLNGTGSGSKIVNVGSRTRFTLTCDGQTSHADVELRPTVWNS